MPSDTGARIRAKFPLDEALVEVFAGRLNCWKCERETPILSGVRVRIGEEWSRFNLAELGEFDQFESLREGLGPIAAHHRIERRFSATRGRDFLCNGCLFCGALLGEYLDFEGWAFAHRLCTFPVRLDEK